MHTIAAPTVLNRLGEWMRLHSGLIRSVQWSIVLVYLLLIIVPVYLPLPDDTAHLWTHVTLMAQFAFWGIWWPFVLFSMVFFGRMWCGVLCPEGTLTEFASKYGRGGVIPKWIRWGGWPFVAFVLTTVYGQLISVYQYPKAVLLILGGSTVAAILVGYLYGKNKRVWCRYLCPVNGVFSLLAKLSPMHYKVDGLAWKQSYAQPVTVASVNCAPLLPLRHMTGAADCHMCGRCSQHRNAITLTARPFASEILATAPTEHRLWESTLILFGLCGVAIGAFHWTASPWFIWLKQTMAVWLVEHDVLWPLDTDISWWLLTHYPGNNDVFSWLDGFSILLYIFLTMAVLGLLLTAFTGLACVALKHVPKTCFNHLVQSFIPMAGCGVFVGLSATTVSLLRAEHLALGWVNDVRAGVLIIATVWSAWIAWQITQRYNAVYWRRCVAVLLMVMGLVLLNYCWLLLFLLW
jgi:hypothetical protein